LSKIDELLRIMQYLRNPDSGCPWDIRQTFQTIAPYTVEEAYEVADAIERNDLDDLREELGDLLFQVVFHSQMAAERKAFKFDDVVQAICDKLIRRHPHVFADAKVESAEDQTRAWEQHKEDERKKSDKYRGVLDGVAKSLPGITRAAKLQKRAAKVGFDWPDIFPIFDKVAEEMDELKVELEAQAEAFRLEDELGDLLFSVVNLARHAQVDPETAIRRANSKFERRFKKMETILQEQGESLEQTPQHILERLWERAKSEDM
jgi:MazG family protein